VRKVRKKKPKENMTPMATERGKTRPTVRKNMEAVRKL